MNNKRFIKIGLVSISDRASSGIYEDKGIPSLKEWLAEALISSFETEEIVISDDQKLIEKTLIDLVDNKHCELIFTTGGTGPTIRDVTPEATLNIADKEMPGFGEQMRQISLKFVPTAILSRQVAVIRKKSLIVNLPGQPKAIKQTLEGLKDEQDNITLPCIFAAIPYCIDLIDGPYIETNEAVIKVFRPKK